MALAVVLTVQGVVAGARGQTTASPAEPAAPASAVPPADGNSLAAARALFASALHDEDAGRFALALEKFERVRSVRDTAAIEYRIGTCHEGLGALDRAFRAYTAAEALGANDPGSVDVAHAAVERLAALDARIARLTIVSAVGPPDGEVRVDDALIPSAELRNPIPLLPGRHVVEARSAGRPSYRSEIALAEGAQVSLTVDFAPAPPTGASAAPPPEQRTPERDWRPAAGWIVAGGGVALGAAAALLLVLRHDDIEDLNRACPGGKCPAGADEGQLRATRSRALVEGPVAAGCAIGAVAAAALGIAWIVGGRGSSRAVAVGVAPVAYGAGGQVAMTGTLP
jgi:hypothetical protein